MGNKGGSGGGGGGLGNDDIADRLGIFSRWPFVRLSGERDRARFSPPPPPCLPALQLSFCRCLSGEEEEEDMLCATSLESRPPFCLSEYLLYGSLSRGSLSREEAGYRAAAAGGEKGLAGGMYGCD